MPLSQGGNAQVAMSREGVLRLPDCLPYGLLFAAVFARENSDQRIGGLSYHLTLEGNTYVIDDYWGREDLVRPVIEGRDHIEVLLDLITWRDPP